MHNLAPSINRDFRIQTVDVAQCRIIYIDDFLSNPETFRNYAFEIFDSDNHSRYKTTFKIGCQFHPPDVEFDTRFPGFRKSLTIIASQLLIDEVRATHGLDDSYSSITLNKGPGFHFIHNIPGKCPHVDPCHISTFIYLNTPDMCSGGTGIYRHIPTGKTQVVQDTVFLKHLEEEHSDTPLSQSSGEWELLHLIEMRYNRLCIFNSSIIHKIYLDQDDHPYANEMRKMRLTLNTFFKYTK